MSNSLDLNGPQVQRIKSMAELIESLPDFVIFLVLQNLNITTRKFSVKPVSKEFVKDFANYLSSMQIAGGAIPLTILKE